MGKESTAERCEYDIHIIRTASANVVAEDEKAARKKAMGMLERGEISGSGWHVHEVVELGAVEDESQGEE